MSIDMREDLMEALERMFPKGYMIVYPTDDQRCTRMAYFVPDETEASKDIMKAYDLIDQIANHQ